MKTYTVTINDSKDGDFKEVRCKFDNGLIIGNNISSCKYDITKIKRKFLNSIKLFEKYKLNKKNFNEVARKKILVGYNPLNDKNLLERVKFQEL